MNIYQFTIFRNNQDFENDLNLMPRNAETGRWHRQSETAHQAGRTIPQAATASHGHTSMTSTRIGPMATERKEATTCRQSLEMQKIDDKISLSLINAFRLHEQHNSSGADADGLRIYNAELPS